MDSFDRRPFDAALCADDPGAALERLFIEGHLERFPELVAILNMADDPGSSLHKNVWEHTLKVVGGVPNLLELRWSALLHDVGKARTRRIVRGRVTFHNHDVVGARIVDSLDQRLGLFVGEQTLKDTVRSLVLNHLRPAAYSPGWSDSAVRRLVVECGGEAGFRRLMQLSRADLTTKVLAKRQHARRRADALEARVVALLAEDARFRLPKLTMGLILERSGRRPGPWLAGVKDRLESMVAAGELPASDDPNDYIDVGLTLASHG